MGLSVAVIIYNEEENLVRFLDSVNRIADEIIVVDSFSKDKSKEICLQYSKVKFFEKKFEGYGEQKNYALAKCSEDWVFFPDADEIANNDLLDSFKSAMADPEAADVYKIRFKNYVGHHLIKHGGWGKVIRERFYRKSVAKYSEDKIHEYLISEGKRGVLKGYIHHFTYKNVHHYFSKMNHYSDMMADKMFKNGKRTSRFKIIVGPTFEFLKVYFFKLGMLDGFPGFYIAKTMAYYNFMKYVKLYSLRRRQERNILTEK